MSLDNGLDYNIEKTNICIVYKSPTLQTSLQINNLAVATEAI